MENEKKGNNEMSIELNPEVAGGTYSNLAIITHSDDEFILDFANMQKYESHFGPIDMSDKRPNQNEATFNLGDLAAFNNGTKS